MVPQTKYARSGNINIAYQVFGAGAVDLVVVPGWVACIDVFWEEPGFARFLQRLGSFARVILFDKRGTGLSDRVTDTPTLEERMDDVRAVMDAVGSKRAALLGYSEGGPMCILFAVTYPERTEALITVGSFARIAWAADYPYGRTLEQQEEWTQLIREHWGGPVGIEARVPSLAKDERFRAWWAKLLRAGGSPTTALEVTRMNYSIDVRHVLPSIRVPTLLLHPTRDQIVSIDCSRYMAERIPGAKLVEIDSDDHLPFLLRPNEIPDLVQEFLTGGRVWSMRTGSSRRSCSATSSAPRSWQRNWAIRAGTTCATRTTPRCAANWRFTVARRSIPLAMASMLPSTARHVPFAALAKYATR
jgi:pimeloyl-ACP methyl ester carboxylesterase